MRSFILRFANSDTFIVLHYLSFQSLYRCSDFPEAKSYLLRAQRANPTDTTIKNELAKLEWSYEKIRQMQSDVYRRMFPGWRDVKGDKVDTSASRETKSCSEEFKEIMKNTIS